MFENINVVNKVFTFTRGNYFFSTNVQHIAVAKILFGSPKFHTVLDMHGISRIPEIRIIFVLNCLEICIVFLISFRIMFIQLFMHKSRVLRYNYLNEFSQY